jgi:hypothetical protein
MILEILIVGVIVLFIVILKSASSQAHSILAFIDNKYSVNYYEYFSNGGWKLYKRPIEYYDKDYIEYIFEIKL